MTTNKPFRSSVTLVPEGVWSAGTFLVLTPSQGQVEAVLTRMLAQARRSFEALQLQGAH